MRPGTFYRLAVWLPCLLISTAMFLVLVLVNCYEWIAQRLRRYE